MVLNAEKLIKSIKTRSFAPTGQSSFSDSDILQLANEELSLKLVADLLSVREDFFLKKKAVPTIGMVPYYTVPKRAIGNALKKVYYLRNGVRKALSRIALNDIDSSEVSLGIPESYLIIGDEVMILPSPPDSSGFVEFWYFSKPNEIVESSQVAKILSISESGEDAIIEVDTSLEANVGNNGLIDILSHESPFLLWAEDVTASLVTGSEITIPKASIHNEAGGVQPRAGDYVCPAGQANIPQVPEEYHPILAQMGAARLAEPLGDAQKLAMVNQTLAEMRKQAFTLVANRVESDLEVISNRQGLLDSI